MDPLQPIPTTNLDAGTDSPLAAQTDLLEVVQRMNGVGLVPCSQYGTLNQAVTAIGLLKRTLVYGADITVSANIEIPDNIEMLPYNGAVINHSTYTISYAGSTERWDLSKKFNGTDLVTLTHEAKPQWFGAKGDGVNDDTSSCNKAIVASSKVYFPKTSESYIIDGAVGLNPLSGSVLDSDGATLKLKAGTYASTAHIITTAPGQDGSYNAGLTVVPNVSIRGLKLDGNIANVTGSATGINLYKVLDARVIDCEIKDLPGTTGGGYGIISNYSNNVWLTRLKIDRTDRQNIAIWETQGAYIDQCDLNNSYLRDNILVSSNTITDDGGVTHHPSYQGSYTTITNTKCTNTSATGSHVIRFSGESSGVVENCELTSNNNLQGVYVTDVLHHTVFIKNNIIKNCSYGIEVASNTDADKELKYISIIDNKIINCANGIKYNTNGRVKIQGNYILGTTTQPLLVAYAEDKLISGNIISGGNTVVSIRAEANGSTVFSNNTVRDMTSATRSVFIIGDSTAYPVVQNNTLTGNTVDTITGTIGGYFSGNTATVDAFSANVVSSAYRTLYNAAVPTSSTWVINDRVIRAPAVVGQPKAWTCTVAGTAGTLNSGATTADTTATSEDITVSSVTGLAVGNYITVAGIGGTTTKKITDIVGTTVTVDTAATNTVTGGAVSYVAPTFTSEGNL